MKNLLEIKSALKNVKATLLKKYPIKSLAIFGSYARNEQNENSDLDLVVEFNGKVGAQFIDLADEIEEYLGFKVDLVSRKGIKEKYFEAIKSDLIII